MLTEPGPKALSSVRASFHSRRLNKTVIWIILIVKYSSRMYPPKNREFQPTSQLAKVISGRAYFYIGAQILKDFLGPKSQRRPCMEGEDRFVAHDQPHGVLTQNWLRIEPIRIVTCLVLKAMANNWRKSSTLSR
ncbi:hypothetical protein TNCV_836351 [Trichonephila clavipes]|nr:hypothetical protein TNCV_836351 [Trichonephila clavipes]